MAIVDNYVVSTLVTHQRYGAGDIIHLKPKEWADYQADAPGNDRDGYRKLVRLLYVEKPDGSRVMADERGKVTDKSKVIAADKVQHEKEVRSTVSRLVFDEKLSSDDERDLTEKALGDEKLQLKRFQEDPAGYFQGKHQATRQGAGPQATR